MRLDTRRTWKACGSAESSIFRFESSANSAIIDTILKVFSALNAEINQF